jgi:DNA-binding transcriptional ArsR family regulator
MTLPHPTADQIALPNVLAVLGDPTRLAIVAELARNAGGPMNCGSFLDLCSSKTNLSYHLAKLREAGVTRTEVAGTSRFTSLRREDLDRRFPGLLDSVLAAAQGNAAAATGPSARA